MPTGAVAHHDGVRILVQGIGEVCEKQVHDLGVDARHHQGDVVAGVRAHGGEDVGPLVADLTRPGGTLAAAPPPVTHPALGCCRRALHPETTAVGACRDAPRRSPSGCREAPFFEALLRFGVKNTRPGSRRAFWRENPIRRRTRVMLRGGRSWPKRSSSHAAQIGPGPEAQTPSRSGSGPAMMTAASAAGSSAVSRRGE